ncbi:MAG: hypothetical protein LUH22_19850 [Bacteroides sp.]|nr:hypothetical protein [Bacteroides sp.]
MNSDRKLFFKNQTDHRLNLYDHTNVKNAVENVLRNIIQAMIKEPLIKAILEDELNKTSLPDNVRLSPVRIDQHCNIYLMDYDNAKLQIQGYQAKTLYLFYLLSPVGVSNRDLSTHYELLKKIYQVVCLHKMNDDYRAEVVIRGLLFREGVISEATNKIKVALRKIIPLNEVFEYYMIGGNRNCTRQIAIPKSLIKIDNEHLNRLMEHWKNK